MSAYDDGLYIVWRGGDALAITSRKERNAQDDTLSEWNGPVSVRDKDPESGRPTLTQACHAGDKPMFKDQDEELDDDEEEAMAPLIQELKLSLGSPVLHVAMPSVPTPSSPPEYNPKVPGVFQVSLVVVVACEDGSVRLITLPLTPPTARAKRKHHLNAKICQLAPPASGYRLPRAIALSWTATDADVTASATTAVPHDLLVALSASSITDTLTFYRIPVQLDPRTGLRFEERADPFHSVQLNAAAKHISFNSALSPSPRHSQLIVTDTKGSLKIYDPLASDTSRSRPSSRDSLSSDTAATGAWIMSFDAPFEVPKDASSAHAGLVRRRTILDAHWVLDGSSIIVLLSDGEWGLWNVHGTGIKSLPTNHETALASFVVRGFVGDATKAEAGTAPETKARSNQRLAPMTPNTRKVRQESLFSGPTTTTTTAAHVLRGGISVAETSTTQGAPDDSIVLWYGSDAYHIPSLALLWQRSVGSSGRDVGSLYGPGLGRIEGLDLSGELINSVEQSPAKRTAVSAGSLASTDIIVTGDYRTIIVSAARPQAPSRSLFAQETGSPSASFDMQLLDRGELDLGGMDRMLDGMNGMAHTNGFGKPKRVGFAR